MELKDINTNKYFVGTMMIILTIGGRFIIGELNDIQRDKLNTPSFRKLFIFCAFFMATRDILITCFLTIVFTLIITAIIKEEGEDQIDDESRIENDIINTSFFGAYV